jgi:hypothetical protein
MLKDNNEKDTINDIFSVSHTFYRTTIRNQLIDDDNGVICRKRRSHTEISTVHWKNISINLVLIHLHTYE